MIRVYEDLGIYFGILGLFWGLFSDFLVFSVSHFGTFFLRFCDFVWDFGTFFGFWDFFQVFLVFLYRILRFFFRILWFFLGRFWDFLGIR